MPNIALLELLVIVTAFDIWAPVILASVVTLRLDNEATVAWIQSLKSDIPAAKQILCKLILTCLSFQIHTKVLHIKGELNEKSNLGIHFCMQELFHKFAEMCPNWQPSWSQEDMLLQRKQEAKNPNTEVCQNLEVTGHARKPSIGSQ